MSVRPSILLNMLGLLLLVAAGCTSPEPVGTAHTSLRAPILGVVLDKEKRVQHVYKDSGAEAAGIQVGDILLDATWAEDVAFEPEPLEPLPTAIVLTVPVPLEPLPLNEAGTLLTETQVVTLPVPLPAPTQPVAEYIERGVVSFTEDARLDNLIPYGVPLTIRLQRGDEILEVIVIPNASLYTAEVLTEDTRPTPKPEDWQTY